MIKKILLLILIIFTFAQYGKYCGDGNTNLYGEKPIDLVDDICRIRKICMKAMLTNYCNCQAGISALSIEITGLSSGAENQRELLINSGMPGSFWSDGIRHKWAI